MDCVAREVLEETGLRIRVQRLVGLYYGSSDDLLRIVFLTRPIGSTSAHVEGTNAEILESGWFPEGDLPRPMPTLAIEMIADAQTDADARIAIVSDDTELVDSDPAEQPLP